MSKISQNSFPKKYTILQRAVAFLGFSSLVVGSLFSFAPQANLPVAAAEIIGNLNNMAAGEVRAVQVGYSSADYSILSFPEIRVQIDKTNLEFVDFTNSRVCFDETVNQGIAGVECLYETFSYENSTPGDGLEMEASLTINNNDTIFKSGVGPTAGTLAGTAENTVLFSFCPRSTASEAFQYTEGGHTVSDSDPLANPITDPQACSPADIPSGRNGNLVFWVRAKTGATNTADAMRVILRSHNGNTGEPTTTGYDGNGWTGVSMTDFDLTMGTNTTTTETVIINEVNWAGSSTSINDQWIELYNPTAAPVNISGYKLTGSGMLNGEISLPSATSATCPNLSIPANGYYLIAALGENNANTLLNTNVDCALSNLKFWDGTDTTDKQINLVNGDTNTVIDQTPTGFFPAGDSLAGNCSSATPSGNCVSMARKVNTVTAGTQATSWENSNRTLNIDSPRTYTLNNPWPGNRYIRSQKMTPKTANSGLTFCATSLQYDQDGPGTSDGSTCSQVLKYQVGNGQAVNGLNYLLSGPYLDSDSGFATAGTYKFTVRVKPENLPADPNTPIFSISGYKNNPIEYISTPRDIKASDLVANTWNDVEVIFNKKDGDSNFQILLWNYNVATLNLDTVSISTAVNPNTWTVAGYTVSGCASSTVDSTSSYGKVAKNPVGNCAIVNDMGSQVNMKNFGAGNYQMKVYAKKDPSVVAANAALSVCLYGSTGCGPIQTYNGSAIVDYSTPVITTPFIYDGTSNVSTVFWGHQAGISIDKIEYTKV